MARTFFVIHYSYRDVLQDLSNEKMGELFKAIFDYEIDGIEPSLSSPDIEMAFKFLKLNLDINAKKYTETCEKRKQAGAIGGKQKVANQANASKSKQKVANQAKEKEKEKEKDIDNKKERVKEKGEDKTSLSMHTPKQNALHCNKSVTKSNEHIDKDIDIRE